MNIQWQAGKEEKIYDKSNSTWIGPVNEIAIDIENLTLIQVSKYLLSELILLYNLSQLGFNTKEVSGGVTPENEVVHIPHLND